MRFENLTSQLRNKFDESKLPSFQYARRLGSIRGGAADIDFQAIADALDCHRDFHSAGIIYSDGLFQHYLVRPSKRRRSQVASELTHIIIFDLNTEAVPTSPEVALKKTVSEPSLISEIGSTALSCGAALAFMVVEFSASVATPFTAGTSSVAVVLAYGGAVASSLQCGNGIYRVYQITNNGEEGIEHIAWLDSQDWYVATTTLLDITSLVSGSAALKEAYHTYKIMKSTSPRNASEWLKKMPRHERKRLTEEIIRHNNPGISNQAIKDAIRRGKYPKHYPTEEIRTTLRNHLINSLAAGSGLLGSGLTGSIRNPENILKSGNYFIGAIYSIVDEKPAGYIQHVY
ncbi:hypothetical protein ID858_07120 [Xenorhabdus sp. DI]|uniref:hypothetical protein n=1 Tax=Xenorhabdus doucetiae TaxID=351671 RepID=UPI0019C7D3DE|nr:MULTISPECIES: hypothetical protein [unclassified Xenorhabdus]MBD2784628.1 hypothetical protein [Xenorhabdus sp. 3]MBD2788275.1 hypothetical protein [Xenorhabdus sp. DI]